MSDTDLVQMQRHRDAWREYAYGKRDKPADFLDGNKVDRGPTEIERLRQAVVTYLRAQGSHFCGGEPTAADLLQVLALATRLVHHRR
ncbi:MAG: hypothetical protein OEO20_11290 [Gemmatimonadota bacterium]|nr:hypothetical protein [Gemmatimonadota bacterium]MDH3291585.1 hypothetical protein [Gemmatimonadota bacterium]MDH3366488.1 hypothetical protein [Gemmatimonadota bacterium]MDH3478877.1 hypothetical protein [Gemmatimonadota bacterium]MDH3570981.1 hypothetical protein [Gemmatimonadota bacterium]